MLELGGPLALELGLRNAFNAPSTDDGTQLRLVPGAHVGGRGWFDVAGIQSFVGAAFLATSHPDQPVAPGGLGIAGARFGNRGRFVEVALEGGFSRDPHLQLQVGVGLGR